LSFEGAEEGSHMGHADFRVGGKIFASLAPDLTWGMAKLTPEQQAAFIADHSAGVRPASGKWGEGGVTMIVFESSDEETAGEALTLAWQNFGTKVK